MAIIADLTETLKNTAEAGAGALNAFSHGFKGLAEGAKLGCRTIGETLSTVTKRAKEGKIGEKLGNGTSNVVKGAYNASTKAAQGAKDKLNAIKGSESFKNLQVATSEKFGQMGDGFKSFTEKLKNNAIVSREHANEMRIAKAENITPMIESAGDVSLTLD